MAKNENKIKDFLEAYGKLVEEHKVDFATYPMFVPDGSGGFKIICQSVPVDMDEMKKNEKFVA